MPAATVSIKIRYIGNTINAFASRWVISGLLLAAVCGCSTGERRSTVSTCQGDSLVDLPFAPELQEAIDRALEAGHGDDRLGISVAVKVPGYKLWAGVSGYSRPGTPVTSEMLFDVGSIAKNSMAALALKHAEEDLLDLDGRISQWLPNLTNVDNDITLR